MRLFVWDVSGIWCSQPQEVMPNILGRLHQTHAGKRLSPFLCGMLQMQESCTSLFCICI